MHGRRWLPIVLMAATASAHAGVIVEMQERDTNSGKVSPREKFSIQGGVARIDEPEGTYQIFTGKSMISVDPSERSYSVIDRAAFAEMGRQLAELQKKADARLQALPPEQRAKLRSQAGLLPPAQAGARAELVDAGRNETVEGRACRVAVLRSGGKPEEELCIAPFAQLTGGAELQSFMKNLIAFLAEWEKAVPQMGTTMSGWMLALRRADGFPIRMRSYDDGRLEPEFEFVKTIRTAPLPASLFQVPAGYRQEKAFGTGGGRGASGDDEDDSE